MPHKEPDQNGDDKNGKDTECCGIAAAAFVDNNWIAHDQHFPSKRLRQSASKGCGGYGVMFNFL
jgi:hypothetical protein